jgi:two-component system, sensor histidine kinase LadS
MFPRSFTLNLGFVRLTIAFSPSSDKRFSVEKPEETEVKPPLENAQIENQVNRELEQKIRERTQELVIAYEKISQMNLLLYASNKKLEVNIKKAVKDRINQKEFTFEDFQYTYPDENACLLYLSQLKWGSGYECKKCHYHSYSEWKFPFSRRCRKCKYIESASAYTCFHGVKFPMQKAFYMLFLINSRKSITIEELSKIINLSSKTCGAFKSKVQNILKKLKNKNPEFRQIILAEPEEVNIPV